MCAITNIAVLQGSSSSPYRLIDGVPTFPIIPMGDFPGVAHSCRDRSQTNTLSLKLIVEGIRFSIVYVAGSFLSTQFSSHCSSCFVAVVILLFCQGLGFLTGVCCLVALGFGLG